MAMGTKGSPRKTKQGWQPFSGLNKRSSRRTRQLGPRGPRARLETARLGKMIMQTMGLASPRMDDLSRLPSTSRGRGFSRKRLSVTADRGCPCQFGRYLGSGLWLKQERETQISSKKRDQGV